jgi:AmmeMemoRadiSam system protein B
MSGERREDRGLEIRLPAVAGMFYPGSPARLEHDVDAMLEAAAARPLGGRLLGLVEPHAGYMYSGEVAAAGYRQLAPGSVDTVFMVGPSHRAAFPGVAVWDGGAFRTPLGEVPIARPAVAALVAEDPLIARQNAVHAEEHALEVQLPFLQRRLGGFELVPMVMGRQDPATAERLGRALARVAGGPRSLLVASSDLSHYHPYAEAVDLDVRALERVAAFDPEGFLAGVRRGDWEACGGGPIAAVLIAARELGGRRVEVLAYRNSGDVTGDRAQVVGYPACAITE